MNSKIRTLFTLENGKVLLITTDKTSSKKLLFLATQSGKRKPYWLFNKLVEPHPIIGHQPEKTKSYWGTYYINYCGNKTILLDSWRTCLLSIITALEISHVDTLYFYEI